MSHPPLSRVGADAETLESAGPRQAAIPPITSEDLLVAARRAGWTISPQRAQQLVDAARSKLEAFERARTRLAFDDEAADFAAALLAAKHREGAES